MLQKSFLPSNQLDDVLFRLRRAFDVTLRGRQRRVTGELLHVAQAAAGLDHLAGRHRDKGAAAGVAARALDAERAEVFAEPDADAGRRVAAAALGIDHRQVMPELVRARRGERLQRLAQLRVHRDRTATGFALAGTVGQRDLIANRTVRAGHHAPGQLGDLLGAQAGLEAQENDHAVTLRVAATACQVEQLFEFAVLNNFRLPALTFAVTAHRL